MLKVIKGNLFELAPEKCIIAHGCNAQGVMGSGFAKAIRDMYPEAFEVYHTTYKHHGLALGEVIPCGNRESRIIANCITQEYYGRDPDSVYVSYDAVVLSMKIVARHSARLKLPVYLPFIGGGLANGNRNILMAIFEETFKDVEAYLVIND